MLQNLFAAVAPGSLWPVDVLLRVLFSSVDQVSVKTRLGLLQWLISPELLYLWFHSIMGAVV